VGLLLSHRVGFIESQTREISTTCQNHIRPVPPTRTILYPLNHAPTLFGRYDDQMPGRTLICGLRAPGLGFLLFSALKWRLGPPARSRDYCADFTSRSPTADGISTGEYLVIHSGWFLRKSHHTWDIWKPRSWKTTYIRSYKSSTPTQLPPKSNAKDPQYFHQQLLFWLKYARNPNAFDALLRLTVPAFWSLACTP
jgi:hypothetical protein